MSSTRSTARAALEAGRRRIDARSPAGYGVVGYLVIAVVVLAILAGSVLLVTMVMSSVTTQGEDTAPTPTFISQCPSDSWFDSATVTCVPRAVCAEGEEYQESTNTCAVPPPDIDSVAPVSGLATGGTEIRITGAGFVPGATVLIDDVPAVGVVVESDSVITAMTPGSESLYPVDIEVQNPLGPPAVLDNAFTYVPVPIERATEVIPPTGSTEGGEAVIIKGTGFLDGVVVAFGGRPAKDVIVLAPDTLRVTTPIGRVGPAAVNVRLPGEATYVLEDAFAYVDQPPRVILLVRPAEGAQSGGTKITIVGTGFAKGATVTVGKKKATKVKVVSDTRITAVTPKGPLGKVTVGVRNPDMPAAFLEKAFKYVEAPTITRVRPAEGPNSGGTDVTIRGTGFDPGIEVTFGGKPATKVKVVNDTTVTAVTPKGKAGAVPVTVENPDQPIAKLKKAFTYLTRAEYVATLPRCKPYDLPRATTSPGKTLTLTGADLFPASSGVEGGRLAGAQLTFANTTRDNGTVAWRASPPRITWTSPEGKSRRGAITASYQADNCQGSASITIPVRSN